MAIYLRSFWSLFVIGFTIVVFAFFRASREIGLLVGPNFTFCEKARAFGRFSARFARNFFCFSENFAMK